MKILAFFIGIFELISESLLLEARKFVFIKNQGHQWDLVCSTRSHTLGVGPSLSNLIYINFDH